MKEPLPSQIQYLIRQMNDNTTPLPLRDNYAVRITDLRDQLNSVLDSYEKDRYIPPKRNR